MRLLVTGTSGFVGGALGCFARRRGHHVTGLSRKAPRPYATDAALAHDLSRPLAWNEPIDAVIHAAALSAPWGAPAQFDAANVIGTKHALEIADRAGARFYLISSSSVLYTSEDQFDVPEGPAPTSPPVNEYARTKRQAETLVRQSGVPGAILRPRAVFGVGDTVLFPRIARAARLRLLPRFETEPPAQGDLISIDNLVAKVLNAVEGQAEGIFHLTDGDPVQITEFVTYALQKVGLPGPSFTLAPRVAHKVARTLEAVSARSGWWEPPLTGFGVDVFSKSKTFDTQRADAILGQSVVSTEVALLRFAQWWGRGAGLEDHALQLVGDPA